MDRSLIFAGVLAGLCLPGCVPIPVSGAGGGGGGPVEVSQAAIASSGSVNALRRSAGLPPLNRSAKADAAAARHARDMARNGFFAHRGSDGSSHSDRLRAAGCRGGAENIAEGPFTEASVIRGWIGSSSHRRNMLYPAVRDYGLANVGDKWVMVLSAGC